MKIDGIDPITHAQHRLVAEGARKQHSPEHAQTAEARALEASQVKAPNPAPPDARTQNRKADAREDSPHQPAPSSSADKAALEAMVSSVRNELAEMGLVPAPTRYAGVSLTPEPVDPTGRGSGEVTPMQKAQMAMVRQMVRRLAGRQVEVFTPRQLAAEQARREAADLVADEAETPEPPSAPPDERSWAAPGVFTAADGEVVAFAIRVDAGQASPPDDAADDDAGEPVQIAYAGPSSQIAQREYAFRLETASEGDEPGDDLRVYAGSGRDETLVAVGDRTAGAVYIGHLGGAIPPARPERYSPPPASEDHQLDLSL